METASRYEVICPHCNVTYPIDTKVCMHCGGRTSPSHLQVPNRPPRGGDRAEPSIDREWETGEPLPLEVFEEAGEAPPQRSTKMRSLITLAWILLAVGFSIMRACNEG
jgi:hypothetical protein